MFLIFISLLAVLVICGFVVGRARAVAFGLDAQLHSRANYHGAFVALNAAIPMLVLFFTAAPIAQYWVGVQTIDAYDPALAGDDLRRGGAMRDVIAYVSGRFAGEASVNLKNAAETYSSLRQLSSIIIIGACLLGGIVGLLHALRSQAPQFRARNRVERAVTIVLAVCAFAAVVTTIGIVLSVALETYRFFERVSPIEFLFGAQWSPQTAIRADQVGSSGAFGIVPLVTGTMLITTIALLVAGPIGLFAAIYMAEYATPRFRGIAKPVLEILAGVPTVVLGFFAALTVAPAIRDGGQFLGLEVSSESALAAGLVMGMMIIPFISSLSDDVINAVPQSLRDGSYAMGATRSETIKKVVLPAAFGGIVSAFMLAISRAVGETMIVVMAAGLAGKLTFNPLEAVTTFTVQIKTILVGDQEFDSAKTLSAFALAFVLFFFTLTLNVIALQTVKRYREQYD